MSTTVGSSAAPLVAAAEIVVAVDPERAFEAWTAGITQRCRLTPARAAGPMKLP